MGAKVVLLLIGLPLVTLSASALAVGMLISLNMAPLQLVIAVTMLTIYFPCVATFAVLIKELGLKDMLKSAAIMIGVAIIVGLLLRIILLGV